MKTIMTRLAASIAVCILAVAALLFNPQLAQAVDKEFRLPTLFWTTATFLGAQPIVFEGATVNAYKTTLAITDPTANRTITLPNVSGTVITTGNLTGTVGTTTVDGLLVTPSETGTCASDGAGTSPTCTLTPTKSFVRYTCNDTDGCTLTLSKSGAVDGQRLTVINVGANTTTLADSAGVVESAASALGQWDSASFIYASDRWVQISASNN